MHLAAEELADCCRKRGGLQNARQVLEVDNGKVEKDLLATLTAQPSCVQLDMPMWRSHSYTWKLVLTRTCRVVLAIQP